jgi:Holliday junction resolvase RusA-like endonuclease
MSRILLTFSCPLDHAPLPRPPLVSGRGGQQYYKGGPAYQAYKATLRAAAEGQWDSAAPYDGPTEIRIVVEFDQALRPKSRAGETWHLKPPDSDNLLKPIQDALTGLCFSDDRTVTVQRLAKIWGPENRVTVQLRAHVSGNVTDRGQAIQAAGLEGHVT